MQQISSRPKQMYINDEGIDTILHCIAELQMLSRQSTTHFGTVPVLAQELKLISAKLEAVALYGGA